MKLKNIIFLVKIVVEIIANYGYCWNVDEGTKYISTGTIVDILEKIEAEWWLALTVIKQTQDLDLGSYKWVHISCSWGHMLLPDVRDSR